jgi:hypothetical protein
MTAQLAAELRNRAAVARRLSEEVRDPCEATALQEMADELEEEAARREQEAASSKNGDQAG